MGHVFSLAARCSILIDDAKLAARITALDREPGAVADVAFFLSARGEAPPSLN